MPTHAEVLESLNKLYPDQAAKYTHAKVIEVAPKHKIKCVWCWKEHVAGERVLLATIVPDTVHGFCTNRGECNERRAEHNKHEYELLDAGVEGVEL
jgi:hypothetical protein